MTGPPMQADYDELRGPKMRVELPHRVDPEWIEELFRVTYLLECP